MIYKPNVFQHWQQEAEGGNPREKGNTRNAPQFALAFSPGSHHTPKHTALGIYNLQGKMEAFGAGKELEFVATGTREKGVAEACVGAALLLG